jgi:hypothetical protein
MGIDPERARKGLDDRPPVFRSWTAVYALVIGFLAFLVLVFHLLTRYLA